MYIDVDVETACDGDEEGPWYIGVVHIFSAVLENVIINELKISGRKLDGTLNWMLMGMKRKSLRLMLVLKEQ